MGRQKILYRFPLGWLILLTLSSASATQTTFLDSEAEDAGHFWDEPVVTQPSQCQSGPVNYTVDPTLVDLIGMQYWDEEVYAPNLHKLQMGLGGRRNLELSSSPYKSGPWHNNIIPYKFEDGVGKELRREVMKVIQTIHAHTCLKFLRYERVEGQTTNQRFCVHHDRYVLFSNLPESSFRPERGTGRGKNYDLRGYHSRFHMMKNLSETHNCGQQNSCENKKMRCVNGGYQISHSANEPCRCVCLSGLDPLTGCRKPITAASIAQRQFPRGIYALPLRSDQDGCPTNQFTKMKKTYRMSGKNFTWNICAKLSYDGAGDSHEPWPLGSYCVIRLTPGCGDLFEVNSTVEWSDALDGRKQVFGLCCKNKGFNDDPLSLSSISPMSLVKMPGRECMHIPGMSITSRSPIRYNTTRPDNTEQQTNRIPNFISCRYKPVDLDCGGVMLVNRSTRNTILMHDNNNKTQECLWFIKITDHEGHRIALDFDVAKVSLPKKPVIHTPTTKKWQNQIEVQYTKPGSPGQRVGHTKRTIMSSGTTMIIKVLASEKRRVRFRTKLRILKEDNLCYDIEDKGLSYAGNINFTRDFERCLNWEDVKDHCPANPYNTSIFYTTLTGNNCRNPTPDERYKPWCYTSKPECTWNYCDVCLQGKAFDTRKDCFNDQSNGCPFVGCASTCFDYRPKPPSALQSSCGTPENITYLHTEIILNSYKVGDRITLKCGQSPSEEEIVCLTSGQWSPMWAVCPKENQCEDVGMDCVSLMMADPLFCEKHTDVADRHCRFSCGLICQKESTPECRAEFPGLHAERRAHKTEVTVRNRGFIDSTRCMPEYFPSAGNQDRVCLSSGNWSGLPLSCQWRCPQPNAKILESTQMCYWRSQESLGSIDAARECNLTNGILAEVRTEEENKLIYELVKGASTKAVWIGLNRGDNGPGWFWLNRKDRPFYANWKRGQPKGQNRNCVAVIRGGLWKSFSCSDQYQYICMATPELVL